MSEIVYYKSEDAKIIVTDRYIRIFEVTYKIEHIRSGEAFVGKPDQTLNFALALIGIFCIILGKVRSGQLNQLLDIHVLFSASNYFDLIGLVFILITLLITLPQSERYAIKLKFKSGKQKVIMLIEKKHFIEISIINKAIKQAIRYSDFKTKIS